MHQSSDSIARLASALAKAQIELVNPEKSLVATIGPERDGEERRSFNYASLASGLDIVRKTLGQHEIATVQTTRIDQSAGVVNLTTVLAHSSGEWIASDWPVCAVAQIASPHRMGAALSYARRYALFTLVGIAGEDDLDAPDLQSPRTQRRQQSGTQNGHLNAGRAPHQRAGQPVPVTSPLGAEASAVLRDRLLANVSDLGSAEEAAIWAYRHIGDKNKLCGADAQCIEEAFAQKLASFAPPSSDRPEPLPQSSDVPDRKEAARSDQPSAVQLNGREIQREHLPAKQSLSKRTEGTKAKRAQDQGDQPVASARPRAKMQSASKVIDKNVLALPEPRRIRDREHIRHVANQSCLVCGRIPCDAHHLRFIQTRALGRKVSDEFTVPLCRGHHREAHRCGDEAVWWRALGIEPTTTARILWLQTHPLPPGQGTGGYAAAAPLSGAVLNAADAQPTIRNPTTEK
jgi:hypothetical protein